MMEPISIHNAPAQLDSPGRPKWPQQKRNPKSHRGATTGNENVDDTGALDHNQNGEPSSQTSDQDGIVGTKVDLEA